MSINDFMNKIKGQINIDRTNILLILILVLVGVSSFGLGRLSALEGSKNDLSILDNKNVKSVKEEIGKSSLGENTLENNDVLSNQKMYVASKNGKIYYSSSCTGASRIKPENQMWFSSKEEAEDSGYTLAKSCQ